MNQKLLDIVFYILYIDLHFQVWCIGRQSKHKQKLITGTAFNYTIQNKWRENVMGHFPINCTIFHLRLQQIYLLAQINLGNTMTDDSTLSEFHDNAMHQGMFRGGQNYQDGRTKGKLVH